MLTSLRRRRIETERREAVVARERAARDLVAAFREAEAAMDAMRAANDKLYRSDVSAAHVSLTALRQSRERMFGFTVAKELKTEAPTLTQLLGVRVAATISMPLVDFIIHTSAHDLRQAEEATKGA